MNIGIRLLRRQTILSIYLLAALILQSRVCSAQYSFTVVPVGNNIEYRLYYNQFQFGTVLENPQSAFIFRPHPDQYDINGWGTDSYLNPFLKGGDPSQGASISPAATAQGIQISLAGWVNQAGQTNYGNFTYNLLFSYDQTYQKVYANGDLAIQLAGTLASANADLNLSRISSNMLTDVPLQTGSSGVTGDMSQALIQYAPAGDPRDFAWYPPDRPAHYPQDFSRYLSINAVGAVNVVDTAALGEGFQIAIARKPSLQMAFQQQAQTAGNLLSFGGQFDTTKAQDFSADNIGMNHLILQNRTDLTNLNFNVYIQSEPGVGLKRNLVWNQAGGTWDTSVENLPWLDNGQNAFFILGDQVTFGDAGVGPVAVAPAGIAPDSMRVQNSSGNYIFSGGPIGGSAGLEKSGGGALTLTNTNTYTGDTSILAGILALDAQGQISPVSPITNDATLQILSGDHTVGAITGNGITEIDSGSLTVSSIAQNTLTLGPGATLTIQAIPGGPLGTLIAPIPEPSPFALLGMGAISLLAYSWQRRQQKYMRQ